MSQIDGFRAIYDNATAQIKTLQEEREKTERHLEEISRQLEAWIQTANAAAPMVGEEQVSTPSALVNAGAEIMKEAGITATVRMILRNNQNGHFSPPAIRERIKTEGWDLEKTYTNPLSVIHTVLRRMVDSGEISEITTPDGKKYKWGKA
jgi:hypothetical protein